LTFVFQRLTFVGSKINLCFLKIGLCCKKEKLPFLKVFGIKMPNFAKILRILAWEFCQRADYGFNYRFLIW